MYTRTLNSARYRFVKQYLRFQGIYFALIKYRLSVNTMFVMCGATTYNAKQAIAEFCVGTSRM